MTARYHYRNWDGSQDIPEFDTDELLQALAEDLLENGDLEGALERLMRRGFERADGSRLEGLREMLERVRERRSALESEVDPDGRMAEIASQLDAIEALEQSAIDELVTEAEASGDERRAEVTREVAAETRMALELSGVGASERLRSMSNYEFVSSEAREQFENLISELRQEILESYFSEVSEALTNPDPEAMARMREAFDALSTMLEQRERGEAIDPSFEAFMEKFGDLFEGAENLDDLLAMLAERMAAAEAMWNSMSPQQRAELSRMADQLFGDEGLRWSMERLMGNLRNAFPEAGWDRSHGMRGEGGSFSEAADISAQLNELASLEEMLSGAVSPSQLAEVDLDKVARHLGDDAARNLEQLAEMAKALKEKGLAEQRGDRLELTAQGVRRMGSKALSDLFSSLRDKAAGSTKASWTGLGHDREYNSRQYEFGDPLNLDLSATVSAAVRRAGPGIPLKLHPDDFQVVETEALARSATVLCLDLSMSMPMRGNFVPAKKMAMALQQLIATRYPRDYLGIVSFSEIAREVAPEDIPTLMWEYIMGTNLQHALMLARHMLRHQHGTKQIIVVTDGEPTAHITDGGWPEFNYPPLPETLEKTMAEVIRCTKAGITINTFALDLEHTHFPFVDQIAKVNGGRTFYTSNDELGGYVLHDFITHRRTVRPAS